MSEHRVGRNRQGAFKIDLADEAERKAEADRTEQAIDAARVDHAEEIRETYRELTTRLANGRSDPRAFEECCEEYGYRATCAALEGVSAKATARNRARRNK